MNDDNLIEFDKEYGWREIRQEGGRWIVAYFEVTELKDNEVIVTKHGMKIKAVPGKCQDCCFRVNRGLMFCDCQGEVPEEYLIKGGICSLKDRKFIKVKANKGI